MFLSRSSCARAKVILLLSHLTRALTSNCCYFPGEIDTCVSVDPSLTRERNASDPNMIMQLDTRALVTVGGHVCLLPRSIDRSMFEVNPSTKLIDLSFLDVNTSQQYLSNQGDVISKHAPLSLSAVRRLFQVKNLELPGNYSHDDHR